MKDPVVHGFESVKILERSSYLKPALEIWLQKIRNLSPLNQDHLYFWENELANVGLFASSLWQAGWFALQELQDEKDEGSSHSRRVDLWCKKDSMSIVCEAKCRRIRFNTNAEQLDVKINNSFLGPVDQLRKINNSEWTNKLALVFCVPRIPISQKAEVPQHLYHLESYLIKSATEGLINFFAFHVLEGGENNIQREKIHPGVALIGRFVE